MITIPLYPTLTFAEHLRPDDNEPQWQNPDSFGDDLTRFHSSGKLMTRVSTINISGDSSGDGESPRPCKNESVPWTTPIGKLPIELLEDILSFLMVDLPPASYAPRNEDLVACLLTSKSMHAATLSLLYRNITIPHSQIFAKMLANLTKHPDLGPLVRRLNFSHYTSVGFGRTRRGSNELLNVKPETLIKALKLLPNLQEFLVHEHLDDELTPEVLRQLFEMSSLVAMDFCASSSHTFVTGMNAAIVDNVYLPATLPRLRRLNLHECETLQAPVLESLLPRLVKLTHLDVAHTLVTDKVLESIPSTARLTHLNLIRCTRIIGLNVVRFLTTHPAVKNSLVYLNLHCDISRYRLLSAGDVSNLLPNLPRSLRSLNLTGAHIIPSHMTQLLRLGTFLEELGLGFAELEESHLHDLIFQTSDDGIPLSTLRYLDLTGIEPLTLHVLDRLTTPLKSVSSPPPLSVIEVSELISPEARKRHNAQEAKLGTGVRWVFEDQGRRTVLAKKPWKEEDGARGWKMGAKGWGMRKVPIARQEVGGMYGFYMFKK